MSPTEMLVNWLVMPVSLIFGFKRIPFDNLLVNGSVWAVPFAFGVYVSLSENASGWRLLSGMAAMMIVYGVLVYGADRAEAWLARRQRR